MATSNVNIFDSLTKYHAENATMSCNEMYCEEDVMHVMYWLKRAMLTTPARPEDRNIVEAIAHETFDADEKGNFMYKFTKGPVGHSPEIQQVLVNLVASLMYAMIQDLEYIAGEFVIVPTTAVHSAGTMLTLPVNSVVKKRQFSQQVNYSRLVWSYIYVGSTKCDFEELLPLNSQPDRSEVPTATATIGQACAKYISAEGADNIQILKLFSTSLSEVARPMPPQQFLYSNPPYLIGSQALVMG